METIRFSIQYPQAIIPVDTEKTSDPEGNLFNLKF
jgi:hypothetical protein